MTNNSPHTPGPRGDMEPANRRHWLFPLLVIPSLIILHIPLSGLLNLALQDERYSYVLLAPVITSCLIWLNRRRVFGASGEIDLGLGIPLLLAAIGLVFAIRRLPSSGSDTRFSLTILGVALVLIAEFVLCYGRRALGAALFPLAFLLFAIPIPANLMDQAVTVLQTGSADVSYWLFKLMGVPVFRDGFIFSLPGVNIEVAQECSGIRSSLSLLISSILAGYLMLRSGWNQLWLALLTVPIVIFKNAVRIVTISWLGVYFDKAFFYGNLHRHGGLPFSLVALAILYLVIRVLQKFEGVFSKSRPVDEELGALPYDSRKPGLGGHAI